MPGKLPTRIGRYEIQGKLGEGAFGRVYKAYDPTVNRWVAIKVLLATDKEVLTRFKNEAMVAGNLRHKNIVTIYEFGEHEGQPFLAMEFLDGQNLQEVMRSKEPRTMLQRIAIMSQVAEGLDCAHRSGVVHRDVKPANIMVLPDATVKIMDFGIARLTSDREATRLTQEGNMLGTLLYMAPEQFTPNTEVDALCDIFAYGEIYYELLAGKHPFEAGEPRVLMYKLNTQDPPPIRSLVPDCPDAMDQVLNRLLAKQRDLRYQSLRDLLYDTQPMLIELQQERAASLAAEALELFQQQKLEEANRLMPEILELDPGNRTSYRLREAIQKELRDRVLRPKIEALLKTGREELERRNFYEAIEAFDSAWRLDSTNIEIQGFLENARALQEKSHRAAQLVAEARQAFDKQKLAAAYKSASEALLQDPQNPAATRLLQVIQGAIDQKRQQQRLEQALAKAENLLLFQEYEEALAALSEFDTRDQQVGSLIARIRTQKLEHERSVRLQGGMATATELLRNRRLSEAVDHLTRLFADFPETAELRYLLDYARNELAAEERARAVLRIGAEAQARADSRDFRGALDVLEKALQQYDDSSLVRLLGTVMAAKAAWEREEIIRTTKGQCERLRGEGRLAEAIQAAESAVRSYGADPVLMELLRDLERQREEEKRNQEIRKALGQARKLLDAGEFEKAGRYLSDAARQFPESPEIQAALTEAQQALRAREKARAMEACAREVRSAVDRADYDSALQVVERALKAYADESALSKLRDSVLEKQAAWLRKQEVERAVQRAGSLTKSGRFPEASEVLAEALQRFNGEPVLEEARQKLERDWARHKRAQEVSTAARQAKTLLDQDQPQAAADFLVQACARYPAEAELEKLLARAQRAAAVEQACRDARALAAQREFGRALELIEQGLKNWPGELSLISLQKEAAADVAALLRERAIGDTLRRCEVLAGQERFADALRLVESSLQTYPGDPGLLAARSEMQARLEEAERLRQRAADLEALNRLARDARSITDASKIGGLREKVRALADQHPNDSEITEAARNALDQLSTMEEASSLLAKQDFAGVLGLSTPYLARIPDHRFFQRLQAEAERGERLVRLAEIRRHLEGEPNLQRKAQLLDAAFRLYPNEAWLQQEAQVVREKLGLVNSVVAKARRAEESEGWDEALGQWNAMREIYRDYPELDREIARVTDVREKARAAARTRQIEQIQQYVNAGNYDRGGDLLQVAERELAGDPRLQPARERIEQVRQSVREAKALAANHKFEQASKALEGALARYPADALLQRQLQDVQQQAERQAALRQEAIRDAVRRCDLLAEQGKFADALQLAEASLDENPGHPDLLAVRKRVQDRLAEAERLRQRNADLDALSGMNKQAQSISNSTQIGGLRENIRALAGQYPSDPEIAQAASNTLQRLAAMEDASALLAKQDFPAVLAACAKYPDHKFLQLLKSEAERGERAAHLAEAERQVQEEPDLMRRAELLDRTTRLYPDATWLRQESQVVQERLGQVKALVEKARQAEAAERWDEAIEQWSAVRGLYKDYPDLAKEMERVAARKDQARLAARERLGEQIWQHVNAGDYDKAGGLLEKAEKEFPGDAEFQFLRGQVASIQQSVREARALAADQQFEQASKILEAALTEYQGDAFLQRQLQDVQQQAERQAALRREAIREAVRRCELLAEQGNFAGALRLVETSLEQYPDHPDLLAVRRQAQSGMAEAERLRQRNTDLDTLRRLDKEAQAISDSARIGALGEKVRALAGQYPSDSEITRAANNTLQQLSAMEDTGALLAKQEFSAVLAACAKYPDHKFFQRLKSEAERGERLANLAKVERQVREEPDLIRRAELLDRTTRLYPDATWLRQESQVVQGKLGQIKTIADKARQAEAVERWDEALEQWRAVQGIYKDYPDLAKEMERVATRKEQARIAARERMGEQIWQQVNAGDYDKAGGLLASAEKEFPGDAEFQFLRGQAASIQQSVREARALAADQQFEQASKTLQAALARYPGDALLLRELRDVQRQAAEREQAIREAVQRCGSLAEQGNFPAALRLAETSLEQYPDHPDLLAIRWQALSGLAEAERLRQRNADLDALRRLDKEAQSISDSSQIGGLGEKVRALAGQYPGDSEITQAAGNTLQLLSAMEDTGPLLAKQDFPAVLAACAPYLAKYPDHRFFQRVKAEAERGERLARLAEAERQVRDEPDLMRRAELLNRTTRLYPDATWLRQESQVVLGKLGQVKAMVEKARQADAAERWDEALEQWSAVRGIYKDYPDLAKEMERVATRKAQARIAARERLGEQIWQHVNAGDYDKASRLLERGEKEFPGDAEFQFLRGQVASIQQSVREARALAANQQFEQASEILETALARNAGDVLLQRELQAVHEAERRGAREAALASANDLLAKGRSEDAFRSLEKFNTRYGSDPAIEQLRDVIECAREAAQRKLAIQDAVARCATLERENRLAEALAEIERSIAEFGDEAAFQQSRQRVQSKLLEEERRRRRSSDIEELHRLEAEARQASGPGHAVEILEQARVIAARYKGDAEIRTAAAAPIEQMEAIQTAQRELTTRNFKSTLDICQRLLAKYPGYVAFGELKGQAERGQQLAFIEDLQKRVAAEPNLEARVRLLEDALKRYPGERWADNELRTTGSTLSLARSIAEKAEAHEKAGQWDEALAQWNRLRTSYKAYPDLEARLKRVQGKREELRAAAIAEWSEKVEAQIKLGDLTSAGDLLSRAGAEFPGTPAFDDLSRRLERMRQERARIQALLASGQKECESRRYQQGQAVFKEAYQAPQSDAAARKLVLNNLARYAQVAVKTDWRAAESLAREATGLDLKFELPEGLQAAIAERKKEEIVTGCLEHAEQLRKAGDFPGALVEVERGLLAYPEEARLKRLREPLAAQVRKLQDAVLGELDLMRQTAAAATDPAQLETMRARAAALGIQYQVHAELKARSEQTVRELTARIEQFRQAEREASAAALRKKMMVGAAAAVLLAGGFFVARTLLKPTELIPLAISTSPLGAAIKAGTEVCSTPNCELKLKPGTYPIEARLDGYRPAVQTVTVDAANHSPVKLVLEPLRPQIQVLSNFDAGTVLLDERSAGELQNGQLTLENVAFGKHSLMVRSPDGQAKVAFTTAAGRLPSIEGKVESIDVDAVAVTNLGRNVRLECDCPGDKVTVDGKSVGQIADGGLDLHELSEGSKSIKLGERPLVVSVRPEPGLTLFVNSNRNIGTLVVETNVDNPTILINHRRYSGPIGAGLTRIPLDVAQYRVQLQKNGFKSAEAQTVQIEKGGTARLVFTLQPMNAVLHIQRALPGTQVAVDGKPVGQVQQDQRLTVDVSTGPHTIELSKQGYTPKRISRNFEAGQTVAIEAGEAVLSPDQNTIEETRRRGEQAAWDAVNKNDRASLQQFLDSHGNSRFAADARAQIARLDQAKTDQQRQEQLRRDEEQRKTALAAEQKAAQAEELRKANLEAQRKAAEDEQQRKRLEAAQAQQRANADKQAVLDALNRYAAAYNNRDADAVRAIYPSVDFKKIQSSFKISREIRVTLVPEDPRILGESATVRSQRYILFTDDRGKKLPQHDTVTFVLRNIGGRWQIQAIQ